MTEEQKPLSGGFSIPEQDEEIDLVTFDNQSQKIHIKRVVEFIDSKPTYQDNEMIEFHRIRLSCFDKRIINKKEHYKYKVNRPINKEKVNDLRDYQIKHFKDHKRYNYDQQIYFSIDKRGNSIKLIDGQHRFACMLNYTENNKLTTTYANIIFYICTNSSETLERFKSINNYTHIPDWYMDTDGGIEKVIRLGFNKMLCGGECEKKRTGLLSISKSPQRPHLNKENFISQVIKIRKLRINVAKCIRTNNSDKVIELVAEFFEIGNDEIEIMSEFDASCKPADFESVDNWLRKCKEHDMYFGRAYHDNYTKWVPFALDKVKWTFITVDPSLL